MKLFKLAGFRFLCDPEVTQRVYDEIRRGGHYDCVADEDRNYAAVRNRAYSEDFLVLLFRLGVDPDYEAETSLLCRMAPGRYQYAGWFHFVGSSNPDQFEDMPVNEDFGDIDVGRLLIEHNVTISERTDLVHDAFSGHPVVQLDFGAVVPWAIDAPEPE